jgi:carbamoyl-phosphate synthase large subunit
MPRRTDIDSVLVIGSGPIVIGQASEFDYSGTQACRVLKEEGFRVILVNSNPATIMTDPEFADATYVEPITPEYVQKVIEKERPDVLLATLGGQTALNAAIALHEAGVLEQYGVELIGADVDAIRRGEDRRSSRRSSRAVGGSSARSAVCHTMDEVLAATAELGYPVVVRPSFTMGGSGSASRTTRRRCTGSPAAGLIASPTTEVLLEESILGWKEYELELMRDRNDNVVVICSIENVDPMGVHTGDSVTVAPALTLTDREYQTMRDLAIAIIREVGVDTGGCNIQFAVDPADGRLIVIEMNPRVSRSSALASKATGFPIAKIAAKVAIGYTLDEIPNDITRQTPASFEPALDYVVVKVPRFAFEKFPAADATLTTHMKSVGEAMAIGRNYTEALQKALRSLEKPDARFTWADAPATELEPLLERIRTPHDGRLRTAMDRAGPARRRACTRHRHRPVVRRPAPALIDECRRGAARPDAPSICSRRRKRTASPTADRESAACEDVVRAVRRRWGSGPVSRPSTPAPPMFAAPAAVPLTPLRRGDRGRRARGRPVLILGSRSEPQRQWHRVRLLVRSRLPMARVGRGYETVMVNCNPPRPVSTDYDTSDRLYFEPLTLEDVLEVVHASGGPGRWSAIVQLAGRRRSAGAGLRPGVPIVGTTRRPSTWPRTGASGRCSRAGCRPPHGRHRLTRPAIAERDRLPVSSAVVRAGGAAWRSCTTTTLRSYIRRPPVSPAHRCSSTGSSETPSRSTSTRSTDGQSCSRRRDGAHRGGRRALRRLACALPPITAGPRRDRRIRGRPRPSPHGVGVRGCSTCSTRWSDLLTC